MLESVKSVTCGRQSEMKGNHADLLLEALNISNKKEDDHNTDFDQVINTLHKEIGAGGRRLDILNNDSGGFDFEDDLDEPAVYQGMCYISPASLEHSDPDQAEAELDDEDVAQQDGDVKGQEVASKNRVEEDLSNDGEQGGWEQQRFGCEAGGSSREETEGKRGVKAAGPQYLEAGLLPFVKIAFIFLASMCNMLM